ncbi:MAG: sulfatase-like hydrolase/transferase [Pirellulaceae bacterium]
MVFTDDQGYGDVSTYHSSDCRTPNIDRLASEGMLFNNMRANCTVCSPSRGLVDWTVPGSRGRTWRHSHKAGEFLGLSCAWHSDHRR